MPADTSRLPSPLMMRPAGSGPKTSGKRDTSANNAGGAANTTSATRRCSVGAMNDHAKATARIEQKMAIDAMTMSGESRIMKSQPEEQTQEQKRRTKAN